MDFFGKPGEKKNIDKKTADPMADGGQWQD
jgi:hypothetical protein